MSLRARYEKLEADRTGVLDRARACSKLTIPTLFPPDGANASTVYPTPWQSLGARAVSNLAAKLLLALFPPNAPFFRLQIDDFALQKMTQPEMRAEVEKALNRIERAVQTEVETTTARPSLYEALKQLIVGGNTLIYVNPENKIRVWKLHSFVVKRDPMGNLLEAITKECVSPLELPKEARHLAIKRDGMPANDTDDVVDVFTGFKLENDRWRVWQEIEGKTIPGSEGAFPKDKCPARALRWTAVDGEDYGRGIVEEYLGDFKSLEGLQKAIVQGAAAAAKILFLVRPNGTTKKDVVTKSESGDVVSGNKDDVTVLQMEKFNDFRVAMETRNELVRSLSLAFLLNSAVQRQGERVTAEEIRFMAQELEAGLGGVYSTMSQDLQLPLVSIFMANMERQRRLPTLPKDTVRPAVTTGVEAIGRGTDHTRISGFIADIAPLAEALLPYINPGDLLTRLCTARQLDMSGLVRSEEEVQAQQQQAQQAALLERAAPNVVNQAGQMMAAQQGQ